MFADPGRSVVLLVHPGRSAPGDHASSWDGAASLLAKARQIFGVRCYIVGEQCDWPLDAACGSVPRLDLDPLTMWYESSAVRSEAIGEADTVFIGGWWLDEDVMIAAIAAARGGHDVRLLADLSVPRIEADRQLVYDRLALHAIPATTFRQTFLEWAISGGDRGALEIARNLLNKGSLLNKGRPGGLS